MRFCKKTTSQGQSLAEYVLYGGLMTLVAVGGLLALNSSVGDMFSTAQGRLNGGGGQQANATQNNAAPAANGQAALPVANAGTNPYPMTMAGYQQMLADMPMIIETTGASGATKQMLAYMQAYTEQAVAEGKISPAVAGQLTELANLGHTMATYQQLLVDKIDAADPTMPRSELAQQPVNLPNRSNGTLDELALELRLYDLAFTDTMSATELAAFNQLPFGDRAKSLVEHANTRNKTAFPAPMTATEQFLSLYVQLEQSGALQDPSVAGVVEGLAAGVAELSQSVWDVGKNFTYYTWEGSIGDLKADPAHGWGSRNQQAVKAVQSHTQSAGICATGSGQDTGTFCSG